MRSTNEIFHELYPDEPLPKTTEKTPRDYVRTLGLTSLGILISVGFFYALWFILAFADFIGLVLIVGLAVAGILGYRRR